jgi:hypothetical protein
VLVWLILLGIVLLFVGIIALVRLLNRQADAEIADTANWSEADATIQEGRIEKHDKYHWYPYFAFSYVVADDYLSGEFCLEIEGDEALEVIKKLTGSKFSLNYDPECPASWYIPNETMEGIRVLFRGL